MEIIYRAYDGAEFNSKLECRDYEQSRKICNAISEKRLWVFTYDGEIIKERDFLNHVEIDSLMSNIYYFYCNDKEVLEILSESFAEDFQKNVTYYFDEDDNRWVELDDYIYNYRSILNDLIKIQATIKNEITQ